MNKILGGCLCQKVRYKISSPPLSQGICYCHQCRKSGGAYGSPLMVLQKDSFECLPSELFFCVTKPDQGRAVRRNFCAECGSHIFAQIADFPEIVTVRAATLDDFHLFKPEYLVWTQSAGSSCTFPSGIPLFRESAPLEILVGKTESKNHS